MEQDDAGSGGAVVDGEGQVGVGSCGGADGHVAQAQAQSQYKHRACLATLALEVYGLDEALIYQVVLLASSLCVSLFVSQYHLHSHKNFFCTKMIGWVEKKCFLC